MQQTLSKVKTLEKFVQRHGDDALISNTISKILEYKIRGYEEQIERIAEDLGRFEQAYQKDSETFLGEFKDGLLGDNMDFIEWSSLYQMRKHLIEEKAELEK